MKNAGYKVRKFGTRESVRKETRGKEEKTNELDARMVAREEEEEEENKKREKQREKKRSSPSMFGSPAAAWQRLNDLPNNKSLRRYDRTHRGLSLGTKNAPRLRTCVRTPTLVFPIDSTIRRLSSRLSSYKFLRKLRMKVSFGIFFGSLIKNMI